MKKMRENAVWGSVARDTVNKNLKVDSHIVKWSGVEDLWQGLCSDGSLFFDLSNSDCGFGFNALNLIFWIVRKDIPLKNKNISKEKKILNKNKFDQIKGICFLKRHAPFYQYFPHQQVKFLKKVWTKNIKNCCKKNLQLYSYFTQIASLYKKAKQSWYKYFILYFMALNKRRASDIVYRTSCPTQFFLPNQLFKMKLSVANKAKMIS